MTTTVIIKAHCAGTKEVKVAIKDNVTGSSLDDITLQDGETTEHYVYDGREISVIEVTK